MTVFTDLLPYLPYLMAATVALTLLALAEL